MDEDITNANWNNTIEFIPKITGGKVIKVYDGDTITICNKYNDDNIIYRWNVRLNGIDCPEIKTKDKDEKECSIFIRNKLNELLLNKYVILENIKKDKYGRLLADVIYDGINISEWLIENRYAVKYDGKTKNRPVKWSEYMKLNI